MYDISVPLVRYYENREENIAQARRLGAKRVFLCPSRGLGTDEWCDFELERLKENGYTIVNVDATIIAQRPKLKDYIPQMRVNIAECLELPVDRINVKATTEEGLGFTGRKEGIAAHSVALIEI